MSYMYIVWPTFEHWRDMTFTWGNLMWLELSTGPQMRFTGQAMNKVTRYLETPAKSGTT